MNKLNAMIMGGCGFIDIISNDDGRLLLSYDAASHEVGFIDSDMDAKTTAKFVNAAIYAGMWDPHFILETHRLSVDWLINRQIWEYLNNEEKWDFLTDNEIPMKERCQCCFNFWREYIEPLMDAGEWNDCDALKEMVEIFNLDSGYVISAMLSEMERRLDYSLR